MPQGVRVQVPSPAPARSARRHDLVPSIFHKLPRGRHALRLSGLPNHTFHASVERRPRAKHDRMCDRSRGRSGCTRRRTTARANGPFRVWISGASGCRLPRDVAASGIPNTLPHAVFPEPRLLRVCQIIGPRFAVAILHRTTPPATWRGSHHVQHHDCHTSLDEVPCTNPSQSKTDPALERAPHTRRTGPTLTNLGTGPTGSRASATSHRGNPAPNDLTCHVAWHNPHSHT